MFIDLPNSFGKICRMIETMQFRDDINNFKFVCFCTRVEWIPLFEEGNCFLIHFHCLHDESPYFLVLLSL